MAAALTFGAGALLGLASSLHCVGMCGGIALLAGQAGHGTSKRDALAGYLSLNGGRLIAYTALGGLAGGLGAAAFGLVQVEGAHFLMRWAAAMTLVWIGLAMLDVVPSPARLAHAVVPRFAMPSGFLNNSTSLRRLAAGFGWGLMPCGLVYGAMLYAAFAGSAIGGMAVMAGFGLGTIPALLAVQFGSNALARFARRPHARHVTGIVICGLAALSLLSPEIGILALCRSAGLLP